MTNTITATKEEEQTYIDFINGKINCREAAKRLNLSVQGVINKTLSVVRKNAIMGRLNIKQLFPVVDKSVFHKKAPKK